MVPKISNLLSLLRIVNRLGGAKYAAEKIQVYKRDGTADEGFFAPADPLKAIGGAMIGTPGYPVLTLSP